jgi:hypothetical protein
MKGLVTFVLLVCLVGGVLLVTGVLPLGRGGIQPVKLATSRDEALKLAKDEDLPAIARATKVVITQVDIRATKRRQTTVETKDAIERIHGALTIAPERGNSGGMRLYMLEFYRRNKLVRTAYVHANDEWGIQRPGGSYWIIGKNTRLRRMLDELLAPAGWSG